MGTLDTFYILFKTKGAKEAATDAKSVTKAFLDMSGAITQAVAGALSIKQLFDSTKGALDYTEALGQASRSLNVNVEDLDAWGQAVTRAGGTAAGFQSSLKGLAEHLGTSGKVALQVLPQFADTFQKLGQTRAFIYGKQIGLDEGTILLLQKGRREVDAAIQQQKALGVVQKQDTEIAFKFQNQVQRTGQTFREAFIESNRTIIPILDDIFAGLQKVGEFFERHSDLIVGALKAMALAAGVIAIAFLVMGSPIAIATAALAAFALVYDDISTYFKGGDSLIGRAIERWKELGAAIKFAATAIAGVQLQGLETLWGKAKNLFGGGNTDDAITAGKSIIAQSDLGNIGSQTTSSIFNRAGNNVTTNFTGDIVINTQASQPDGIGDALQRGILSHIAQANANFDDGVVA
jgi:hypothetical protein